MKTKNRTLIVKLSDTDRNNLWELAKEYDNVSDYIRQYIHREMILKELREKDMLK